MKISISGEGFELDSSVKSINLGMAVVGLIIIFIAEYNPNIPIRFDLHNLMLLLIGASIISFGLDGFHPISARWFVIAALTGIILLADLWLEFPGILTLLVIPVSLAIILVGLLSAILVTGFQSGLLLFLYLKFPSIYPFEKIIVAIVALIFIALVLNKIYRQVFELGEWSVSYWKKGHQVYEQSKLNFENYEKALQNLASANQLLMKANQRADRLRSFAENAERTKALFVARVSHEFRTPLNMIIGLIEIMVEAPQTYALRMPPELNEDLNVVLRNSQHLSGMIDDVLDLTRVESGSMSLHYKWVNLLDIFGEATEAVSPLIKKKGLALNLVLPDNLPLFYCDQTRIRQVILNLVSNAARFTEKGGIDIQGNFSSNQIIVSIADTGPGIHPDDVDRIFEPFCQGVNQDSWRDKGGSGLGLSISKQFVELHGGQMWLKSQLGVGTTFFFTLPLDTQTNITSRVERWIQPDWIWHEDEFTSARIEDVENQRKPRILVVDETGGLIPEINRYSNTFDISFIKLIDFMGSENEFQADLIWLNTLMPDQLVEFINSARKMHLELPIVGTSIIWKDAWLSNSENIYYLTKPVTMGKLNQAILETGCSIKNVLVVDDDPEVLSLLQRLLKISNPNLVVRLASSGQEALNRLKHEPTDLILLDIIMPSMTGWEVIENLRMQKNNLHTPVLIISAQDLVDRPPTSQFYIANQLDGFTIKRLLECSTVLSNLLIRKPLEPGLERLQIPGA
jgi:signal transduction histidine kinase/CheY-like chemotaxis protein